MKKVLILFLSLLVGLTLAACGDSESGEKEITSVESTEQSKEESKESTESSTDSADKKEEDSSNEAKEFNDIIADNDHLKATLISIEKVVDEEWDEEYYSVNIEIENKREDTIEVQAHQVSADGRMIDDFVYFSETIAGGKIADGKMQIQNYEGELPSMEENLEFILNVYSHDDYEFENSTDVKIELQ